MIITRTPFRISFVGGGSDLEAFYQHAEGAVLSTTINKFMYISTHSFFDNEKLQVKYSQTETVASIGELKHPVVREALKKFRIQGGVEISSNADVPAGSGLGSSSSFTVGMLHNLYCTVGRFVTKEQLAQEACDIEINKLKEPIGKQDQYAAAYGGLNIFRFQPSGRVSVEPVHLRKDTYKALQENLLMFYTGHARPAASILTEQRKNMQQQEKVDVLKEMVALVWELRDALHEDDIGQFGKILHKNWLLKQQLASGVTSPEINELYEKGLKYGATGGKLLGAGGGGFLLFYCDKEQQGRLRAAMTPLKELRCKFDSEGSKLIYVEDEYA